MHQASLLQHRRHCCARLAARSRRPVVLKVSATIVTDASCRVKGQCRHVYSWVSDFNNVASWQDVANLKQTRGAGKPVSVRHQYQMDMKVAGFNVTTLYEVVDMQQDKKIVYSAGSELHTATEQFIFMPDPNDPSFTVIRHMSHIELTEWRKAFAPIVSGVLKSRPDAALKKLTALLNSSNSPLLAYSHQNTSSSRAGSGGWNFNTMFNNLRSDSQERTGTTRIRAAPKKPEPQVDVLGYYAALGLDGSRPRNVTTEDVKSAFRRMARTMHPDKFSTADEDDRLEAEQAFIKVQKAYEVLRDPQQKQLYDQGKILEESVY